MSRLPRPPRRRWRSTFSQRQAGLAPTAFWKSLPVIQVDGRTGQCQILPPAGGSLPAGQEDRRIFRLLSVPEGTSAIESVAVAPMDQDPE